MYHSMQAERAELASEVLVARLQESRSEQDERPALGLRLVAPVVHPFTLMTAHGPVTGRSMPLVFTAADALDAIPAPRAHSATVGDLSVAED